MLWIEGRVKVISKVNKVSKWINVNDQAHRRFSTSYLFEDNLFFEVWLHIVIAYVLFQYY